MTDKELNEKLAKWAGFYTSKYQDTGNGRVFDQWFYPDGLICPNFDLPNFASSLDTCFKWLVPKLKPEVTKFVSITDAITGRYGLGWGCHLILEGWGETVAVVDKNFSPALALCKAIEKLIDKERE